MTICDFCLELDKSAVNYSLTLKPYGEEDNFCIWQQRFSLCSEHKDLLMRELNLLLREYFKAEDLQESLAHWFQTWNIELPTKIKIADKYKK